MDGPRYRSINNPKLTESDDSEFKSASEESNGSFQTDEEAHEFWNGHEKNKSVNKNCKNSFIQKFIWFTFCQSKR